MTERDSKKMKVSFKGFTGVFKSWDTVCREAAEFASEIEPARVISVSQGVEGVVVWYWEEDA